MQDFVGVTDELQSRVEDSRILEAFRRVKKQTANSWRAGHGYAIASVLLFSVAVGLGFQAWYQSHRAAKRLRATSHQIINAPQEPGRRGKDVGILAMVLADINSAGALPEFPALQELTRYLDAAVPRLTEGQSLTGSLSPIRCPDDPGDNTFGLRPGLCWRWLFGSVFVPPTEVWPADEGPQDICPPSGDITRASGETAAPPPDESWSRLEDREGKAWCLSARVRDSVNAGLQLVSSVNLKSKEAALRLPPSVAQAFFISPDGVLGHVAHQRASLDIVNSAPLIRWESKPYFQAYLADHFPHRHTTYVYLDMTGLGLVVTRCRLVSSNGERVGVLCGDVAVPPVFLDEAMRGGTDASSIDTSEKPHVWEDGLLRYRLFTGARRGDRLTFKTGLVDDGLGVGLVSNLDHADLVSLDEPLELNGGFLMNVGRRQDAMDLLFVEPLDQDGWSERLWFGALACLIVALVLLAVSARKAAAMSESAERGALLRNLQLGVLEMDQDDQVLFGNDRAEEIFGLRLPRFGSLEDRPRGLRFVDLIDSTFVVPIAEDQEAPTVRRPVSYDKIREERQEGESGRYFARVRDGFRVIKWLLISGSPITRVAPDRLGRMSPEFATFGVIEEVSQGLTEVLEKMHEAPEGDRYTKDKNASPWTRLKDRAEWWLKSAPPDPVISEEEA